MSVPVWHRLRHPLRIGGHLLRPVTHALRIGASYFRHASCGALGHRPTYLFEALP
jgi:hypothetical protein